MVVNVGFGGRYVHRLVHHQARIVPVLSVSLLFPFFGWHCIEVGFVEVGFLLAFRWRKCVISSSADFRTINPLQNLIGGIDGFETGNCGFLVREIFFGLSQGVEMGAHPHDHSSELAPFENPCWFSFPCRAVVLTHISWSAKVREVGVILYQDKVCPYRCSTIFVLVLNHGSPALIEQGPHIGLSRGSRRASFDIGNLHDRCALRKQTTIVAFKYP